MKNKSLLRAILFAGLIAGTLDITAAIVLTLIRGNSPIEMLRYIASALFGPAAFSGGNSFAVYGFIFHYCIAMGWTVIFFLIYPKMKLLSKNRFLTGLGYGIFVWLIMNRVVIPIFLEARPFRITTNTIISVTVIIVAIGLPLSFLASRYYSKQSTQT